jgi:hypothetical protein
MASLFEIRLKGILVSNMIEARAVRTRVAAASAWVVHVSGVKLRIRLCTCETVR